MGKKKPSYVDLLKEQLSLQEYDIKDFNYKGPMTEPIISYNGDNEMETHKTITDLLDKYYLKEKMDRPIFEADDGGETDKEPEQNEIKTGETPDDIDETMDDFSDEILEGEPEDDAFDVEDVNESLESAIIERLIKEMEEEVGPDKQIEPEKDEETKQAGTDFADEKTIDKVLEDIALELALSEEDDLEEPVNDKKEDEKKDEEKEDEKELDVDKELKTESKRGLGPIQYKKSENLEESFKIFLEQLEDEIDKEDKTEDKEDKTEDKEDETEKKEDKEEDKLSLKEALKIIFEEDEEKSSEKEDEKKEEEEDKEDETEKKDEDKEDEKKEGALTTEMIDLMLEELDLREEELLDLLDKW